jgi:hypothetical protein
MVNLYMKRECKLDYTMKETGKKTAGLEILIDRKNDVIVQLTFA